MNYIIETTGLTKNYQETTAVNNLDLKIPEGSIYGFLGKNASAEQYEDLS